MGKSRDTADGTRYVDASGDVQASYPLHGNVYNEAGYLDTGNVRRVKLGTAYIPQAGSNVKITLYTGQGYNAGVNQYDEYEIHFRTSNGSSHIAGSSGNFYANGWVKHTAGGSINDQLTNIFVEQIDTQNYAFYVDPLSLMGVYSSYEVSAWRNDAWTHSGEVVTSISGNYIELDPNYSRSGSIRTSPSQPSFQAWSNSGGNEHFAGGTNPSFLTISSNVGNHFDGTTFTAPVSGRYMFFYTILSGTSGDYGLIALNVNGGPAVGNQNWTQHFTTATNDQQNSSQQILTLSANDQVNLYIHPAYNHFYWNGAYSKFGGYLVG